MSVPEAVVGGPSQDAAMGRRIQAESTDLGCVRYASMGERSG
jgi:hypothetical protein